MNPVDYLLVDFADADVTFKSSDGVLFRVHRKNLEVCTEGFPPSEISNEGEVVELTETAATLELLFRFMYPERHPALDTTPFEVLEPLRRHLKNIKCSCDEYFPYPDMVHKHPVEVAVYASKHGYPYLVSEVAPSMISMDPVKVMEILPPHLVPPGLDTCKSGRLSSKPILRPINLLSLQTVAVLPGFES
ncbi:hypothetical protein MSAN_01093700 [Mycena sanguinolenta]|uniref:BTB domain-containing protein n=1 Tax=Mycena sanguinolenta TaxID=230812 RepID=A0A8H6YSG0_9AGAR|nr:hypothetical protein MSAN_01093700 [Mycena sanguinolenta]